ncbi:MAG: hypothetical protein H6741_35705, partial [Alphaproteobacteria bacterium]|nr:hypothetical protein [Alphaproteobacteria bacterium]
MPRMHLMEIEDQAWCPAVLRDGGTAYLDFAVRAGQQGPKVMPTLTRWIEGCAPERLVLLGAGGGGGVETLVEATEGVEVLLTDYYPNLEAFRRVEQVCGPRVRGHE